MNKRDQLVVKAWAAKVLVDFMAEHGTPSGVMEAQAELVNAVEDIRAYDEQAEFERAQRWAN